MDFEDGYDRFEDLLSRQKQVLKDAGSRKGEVPRDRPSGNWLVSEFMLSHMRQQMMQCQRKQDGLVHTSFVPPAYDPSIAGKTELRSILIKDLKLETHHRGYYLLVQCVTPPNRMTAIIVIVEDETGDTVMLQVYNQERNHERPPSEVLDKGVILLIKEPYFKIMASSGYGLRVDHVSDLIRVDRPNSLVPQPWISRLFDVKKDVDHWKVKGDSAMKYCSYPVAIRWYSNALTCECSAQMKQKILLNRAMAYLKDDRFDAALVDCDAVLNVDSNVEKAMYRAGQALYALRRFPECEQVLDRLCSQYPSNSEAHRELKRVRHRLRESETGAYDFQIINEEVQHAQPPYLDHAGYIGPVTLQQSAGRGRGLFASRNIKAGELILCEKALVYCFANVEEQPGERSGMDVLINLETNRVTIGNQAALIQATIQKLDRNPSLATIVRDLYHGNYQSVSTTEIDSRPIIDTFLIERVVSFNAFGCSLRSGPRNLSSVASAKSDQHRNNGSGLWPQASMINHCCMSNVGRGFIGDLQIVRATKDIKEGTELTFWYHVPDGSDIYENMRNRLKHWGFECNCRLCQEAQAISKKQKKQRDGLFADLKATLEDQHRLDHDKAERLITALTRTYKSPSVEVPRLRLALAYIALAEAYYFRGAFFRAASMAVRSLTSYGFVIEGVENSLPGIQLAIVQEWGLMTEHVVQAWIMLRSICQRVGSTSLSQVDMHARTAYMICYGEQASFEKVVVLDRGT